MSRIVAFAGDNNKFLEKNNVTVQSVFSETMMNNQLIEKGAQEWGSVAVRPQVKPS